MQIDPFALSARAQHHLTASIVIPRPIAWVSTVDADGVRNLAPYSCFSAVSNAPPVLMFSASQRDGRLKDTLVNVLATREFVVNIVNETLAQQMNLTSGNYPPEVDEFVVAGLTPVPSVKIQAPRVGESLISIECTLLQSIPVPTSDNTAVFGRVVWIHIADEILDERGRVDPCKLHPVGRVGGSGTYTTLGTLFEMKRPP